MNNFLPRLKALNPKVQCMGATDYQIFEDIVKGTVVVRLNCFNVAVGCRVAMKKSISFSEMATSGSPAENYLRVIFYEFTKKNVSLAVGDLNYSF